MPPEQQGADLPDKIAAGLEMVFRHAALAGVVGESAFLRAPVQRQDGMAARMMTAIRNDVRDKIQNGKNDKCLGLHVVLRLWVGYVVKHKMMQWPVLISGI